MQFYHLPFSILLDQFRHLCQHPAPRSTVVFWFRLVRYVAFEWLRKLLEW